MARSRLGSMPALPPSLAGGNTPGSSQAGFPSPVGKSRTIQNLGNYTGQRAAGLTRGMHGPTNQFAHAFGHYGKQKESAMPDNTGEGELY